MSNIYDVAFRMVVSPIIAVEANNREEAEEKAKAILEEMGKDDILDRYHNSIESYPETEIVATILIEGEE